MSQLTAGTLGFVFTATPTPAAATAAEALGDGPREACIPGIGGLHTPGPSFDFGPAPSDSGKGSRQAAHDSGGRPRRAPAGHRSSPGSAGRSHPNRRTPTGAHGLLDFEAAQSFRINAENPVWVPAWPDSSGTSRSPVTSDSTHVRQQPFGAQPPVQHGAWPQLQQQQEERAPATGLNSGQEVGDASMPRSGGVPDGHLDPLSELIQLLLLPDDEAQKSGEDPAAVGGGGLQREDATDRNLSSGSDRAGASAGGLMDLHALAAALDEVDASLDWAPPPALLQRLPADASGDEASGDEQRSVTGSPPAKLPGAEHQPSPRSALQREGEPGVGQHGPRRPRRAVRCTADTASPAGSKPAAQGGSGVAGPRVHGAADGAAPAGAAATSAQSGAWQLMLSAPSPHNPEALATLLVAGRLINPRTSVPAPLLAAAVAAAQPTRTRPGASDGDAAAGGSRGREADSGRMGLAALREGPAVALVRCPSEHDAAAAAALAGRRVYCPPLTEGGRASWRPLTVVVQSAPGGSAATTPGLAGSLEERPQSRIREKGPAVRRVILSGLPGHMGADDLESLFGSGLQLPGQAAQPQDRRFLLVCPDAISFNSLLAWSGTRLPDKPLDALQQIVPRVSGWTTLRIEEDDGVHLPALVAELRAAAAASLAGAPVATAGPRGFAAAASQRAPWPPRVAGRFHPAELDEMDEMAAAEAGAGAEAEARSGPGGPQLGPAVAGPESLQQIGSGATLAGAASVRATSGPEDGAKEVEARTSRAQAAAATASAKVAAVAARQEDTYNEAATLAAAAAERAESSRGASSSGLAARPAPRPRRGAGGQFAASVGSGPGGGFFFGAGEHAAGPAVGAGSRCLCCPPILAGPSGGMGFPCGDVGGVGRTALPRSGGSGRAAVGTGGNHADENWSGEAAVDLLNKLLALGIDAGLGGDGLPALGEEEERAPFFRRSRKRMPAHFGAMPEDEDDGEGSGAAEEQPGTKDAEGEGSGGAASGGHSEKSQAPHGTGPAAEDAS